MHCPEIVVNGAIRTAVDQNEYGWRQFKKKKKMIVVSLTKKMALGELHGEKDYLANPDKGIVV